MDIRISSVNCFLSKLGSNQLITAYAPYMVLNDEDHKIKLREDLEGFKKSH